jgi:hypothetical protein
LEVASFKRILFIKKGKHVERLGRKERKGEKREKER